MGAEPAEHRDLRLVGTDSIAGILSPTERVSVDALLDSATVQNLTGRTGSNLYLGPTWR